MENKCSELLAKKYPKSTHFVSLAWNLQKEIIIFLSFIIFFLVVIFTGKNMLFWGFFLIICLLLIAYLLVSNDNTDHEAGVKRLARLWGMIIYYSGLVLLA